MATISRAEAEHLARLARLDLAPEELDQLAGQLDAIAGYVARVAEVVADGGASLPAGFLGGAW